MGARISAGSQQESGQGVPASTNTRPKPGHSRSRSSNSASGPEQSQPPAPQQSRGTPGQEGDKNAGAVAEDNFNENGSPSGAGSTNRGELSLVRRSGSAGRGPSRSGPLTRRMNEARGDRSSSSGSGSRTRSGAPKNPIHSSAKWGDAHTLQTLIAPMSPAEADARDKYLCTPLHIAASYGHANLVEMLLRKGCAVGARQIESATPLHMCAHNGHYNVACTLLELGHAEVDPRDKNGSTPLHAAAVGGHTHLINLLISYKADVNATRQCSNLFTALHFAAQAGQHQAVELLAAHGTNLEAKDDQGWTALQVAAYFGHIKAVEVLVNRGANVFAKNSRGKSAQAIAASRGHEAISYFLKLRMDALTAGTSTPTLMRAFTSPTKRHTGAGGSGGSGSHLLTGPSSPQGAGAQQQQSSVDMQAHTENHQALVDALTHPQGALLEGGDQRNSNSDQRGSSGVSSGPTSPLLTFSFYSSKVSRAAAAKAMANVMGGGHRDSKDSKDAKDAKDTHQQQHHEEAKAF